MAIEFFLVPQVGNGVQGDAYRAKYVDDPSIVRSGMLRYSHAVDDVIVMIEAPQAYLDSVAAQPDATRLASEATLDTLLTAPQANAAKTIFEGAFIPGQFINEGDTRREAIRGVAGMFMFSQRLTGLTSQSLKQYAQNNSITLDSTWSTFPTGMQNALNDVAVSFEWNPSSLGITGATTLREIMQIVSAEFGSTEIYISGFKL